MKKAISFIVMLMGITPCFAQNVGIGTSSPHNSAAVDINSTTAGLLPPRLTTVQRNVIASPAAGLVIFNTTTAALEVYNGTSWMPLYSGGRWGNRDVLSFENGEAEIYLNYHSSSQDYGDYLGDCMDFWGDYLAVGAYNDHSPDGTIAKMGTVRILKKGGAEGWYAWGHLFPAEQTSGAHFGSDVDFDGPQLIVGAEWAVSKNGQPRGKAYVYTVDSSAGTVTMQDSLVANDGKSNDYFGGAVAISGTYAIVGAPQYDVPGKLERGVAYIFVKALNDQWIQHTVLSPPDGQAEDLFGARVAISGNTAVVTSLHATVNNNIRAGKVYLYQLVNNTWTYQTTLVSAGENDYDKFGNSLHLNGDTLIIGSSQYNGNQGKNGKVYVFVRSGDAWNLQAILSASDGRNGDGFGHSLHYHNGCLAVGAPFANVYAAQQQGKAYVFRLVKGAWMEEAVLAAHGGVANDLFGTAVATDGTTVFAGAPWATSRGSTTYGKVYFFNQ